MNQRAHQQAFALKTWGGARRGAGRRPSGVRPRAPHDAREPVRPHQPVHVTLRMADHVWNLRSERSFLVIDGALRAIRSRRGFRVVHFSILGNHAHLIVEAAGTAMLANGVRALSIRLAKRLNGMMGRTGPVFEDRYHAHVLHTPAEVRNAMRYVVGNFASHAARRGEPLGAAFVDPFSSAVVKAPRAPQLELFVEPPTSTAHTWLLRSAAHAEARRSGAQRTPERGGAEGSRGGEASPGRVACAAGNAGAAFGAGEISVTVALARLDK